MSKTVIKIENLSKQYRLGVPIAIGRGSSTLRPASGGNPTLLIGQANELATPTTNNRQQTTSDNYIWALKDINLEIKQAEANSAERSRSILGPVLSQVEGIIGKNGAEKAHCSKSSPA